ncbi:TetR/AcrR family transcriptional regulator [Actinoplanes sp. G11-F43]|uniref:TetR/AcrR family transcriptional regulator n=1 Tax=Actinoplanes sp. G11-F43 TaxID=3424130 RepID=UPI003D337708
MNDEKPVRADALRNRRAILEAASQLFAERGLTVSLDEIARHAGLGVGTVYRRFGTRDAIVEALFATRIEHIAQVAHDCLDNPDPRLGLIEFLRASCADLAGDRGLRQVVIGLSQGTEAIQRTRATLEPAMSALVERAHTAGALRPGLAPTDVPMLFMMIGMVGDLVGTSFPDAWERYFELVLTGILSPDAPAPTQPALTAEQFDAAMTDWLPSQRT